MNMMASALQTLTGDLAGLSVQTERINMCLVELGYPWLGVESNGTAAQNCDLHPLVCK